MATADRRVYATLDSGGVTAPPHATESVLGDPLDGIVPDSTPRAVGGIVLAAALLLAFLKWGGFRFSFGVGVGGS